jgi:IclR helix-turn-helix domain
MSSTHPGDIARAAYERARRPAHRHKHLVCEGCGLLFTATRHDARFCSSACTRNGIAKAEGQRLLAALQGSPGLSITALADAAHLGRTTAERTLRQLGARGWIEKDRAGRWRLTV